MFRIVAVTLLALVVAGCEDSVAGSAVTSMSPTATTGRPTNTAGRAHITFDPCKEMPTSIIQQLHLDKKPGRPYTQTDGDIENVICSYSTPDSYYLSIIASNYTLEMDKTDTSHWDYQEFEVNGRRALSFYVSPQPETDECAIDVAATTGVYGVQLGTGRHTFSPYPDCMTAAHKNLEALLPYFPD